MICYKSLYEDISIHSLLFNQSLICNKCKEKFKEINQTKYVNKIPIHFLYEYNGFIKNLIYQYKGCNDIVLKDVFLLKHKKQINKKYKNYTIVFPPSNEKDDYQRGFNHIEKIIECLRLKSEYMFYKSKEIKQSSLSFSERRKIAKVIKKKENFKIDKDKKYLIIDDIYTSGNTIKTLINILISEGVKKENIEVIIIAKTAENVEL